MKKFIIALSALILLYLAYDTARYRLGWYIDLKPDEPVTAFMTLIPEIFSRIILTTSSSFFCTVVYRGIPLREIKTTMAIIRGAMTARIIAMPLSMEKVTMKPPNKRIGALTPKVWELCMKDRIL